MSLTLANVYVGAVANDGTGDTLRTAFQRIDQNFANILAQGNAIAGVSSVAGRTGNIVLTVNDVAGATSIGYVNNQITSVVTAAISAAEFAASSYGNASVATYLAANVDTTIIAINSNITALLNETAGQASNIDALQTQVYSNANVASYLPGYLTSTPPKTIYNGGSSLAFASSGGSLLIDVGGVQVASLSQTLLNILGSASVSGNISAGNISVTGNIAYIMGNYHNWTSNVSTVSSALDQLAARLKAAGF